jgi:hypothetical protein
MNIVEAGWAVVVAFLPFFIPGIFFIEIKTNKEILSQGARILLWSLGINTILLMLGLLFGVSVSISFLIITIAGVIYVIWKHVSVTRASIARKLALILMTLFISSLFIIPFLQIQDGLPTGDVQKSIIWAQDASASNHLPQYLKSFTLLNRDPVDFYTPGLHSVSALVMKISSLPLTTISIFSIVAAVAVAVIAGAITQELFPKKKHVFLPLMSMALLLTQFRFLRYLREPGYHYQNAFGEFFLFGMMLLALSFIAKKKYSDAVLFFVSAVALFFSHQFSMFMGAFAFLFGGLALAIVHYKDIERSIREHWHISIAVVASGMGAVAAAFMFGLVKKIPAIFTFHPHLANLLPNITDYPSTMGAVWFSVGVLGLVIIAIESFHKRRMNAMHIVFVSMAFALFALSQGPNIGIDIPPIRALFYSALPLSIAGAYFFWIVGSRRKSFFVLAAIIFVVSCGTSVQKAYATISHTTRTNSTLTPEEQTVIAALQKDTSSEGVVIDDYNRRSASWIVLSGHPMMTRILSELQTQMNEAGQSKVRNALYMNQLDYEKIFALGSMPEIGVLLEKHSLQYVTGIANSSQFAFAHNSILQAGSIADDMTLFKLHNTPPSCLAGSLCEFLLKPTTLANDIGDDEDTFEHLEVSIRTPQLSDPKVSKSVTYRETTSPYIPFEFNVADYVQKIWQQDSPHTFVLKVTQPVSGLSLITSSGKKIALPVSDSMQIVLHADEVVIDDRGFITLTIDNPTHQRVGIDLVALGI